MNFTKELLELMAWHFGKYKEDSNIGKLIQIEGNQVDEILETIQAIKDISDIDKAYGKNLDLVHGANKNFPRNGLSDTDYIERLKLEQKINNSDGTIEVLKESGDVIFGDSFEKIAEDISSSFRVKTTLEYTGDMLKIPNPNFDKAIASGVENYYLLRNRNNIVIERQEPIFKYFREIECGTVTSSQELGVIL